MGRTLGIGLRIASRIAGQRVAASTATAVAPVSAASAARTSGLAAGRAAGQKTRGVARGIGGFLSPFRRVGGILWLEVTGVFFLLPVLVYAPVLWRTRASYAHGPGHREFLTAAAVSALFLYLGVTSFWRARRR